MNFSELMPQIVSLSKQAGAAIMEIYVKDFDVEIKDDKSPLTAADLASHKLIVAGLRELTPEIPVLSEESRAIAWETRQSWDKYWLVDPLDGTKEFIKRNGEFTVNIALISGNQAIMGVVFAPALDTVYYGGEGLGAFKQVGDEAAETIQTQAHDGAETWKVVGSRSHIGEGMQAFLDELGEYEMVSMGSSLKFCLVAEGSAHMYPRLVPTSEWDTAAAQAIVEAAGGSVKNLDGTPFLYNAKEDLLNPYFIVRYE